MKGLYPKDNEVVDATRIVDCNFSLIDECDIIIADCNPFRGQEPDSGTVCEIGYGIAKKKKIICYMEDTTPLYNKYGAFDKNNCFYENFGFPLNIMIATKATIIEGTFEDAVASLKL